MTKKTLLMAHFTNCDKSTRYRFFSSPKPFLEIDPGTFFGFESIARNDSAITTIMSPRRVPTQFRLKPTRYGLSSRLPPGLTDDIKSNPRIWNHAAIIHDQQNVSCCWRSCFTTNRSKTWRVKVSLKRCKCEHYGICIN